MFISRPILSEAENGFNFIDTARYNDNIVLNFSASIQDRVLNTLSRAAVNNLDEMVSYCLTPRRPESHCDCDGVNIYGESCLNIDNLHDNIGCSWTVSKGFS